MSGVTPEIYVVDDDASIRKSIERLIRSAGFKVRVFASAEEFLEQDLYKHPGCLILDVRMPGISGMELHRELRKREISLPIIFITGHGDIPMSARTMGDGVVALLPKPFDDQALLDAIQKAIYRDSENKEL